jgi:glutaminyl-tRNA synthetase
VSKAASTVEYAFLEHCLREDLNETARRVMAVLRPVKLTITNYPEGQTETFEVENNPNRPEEGTRPVHFSRTVYVEADDFLEEPVPKYKRLYPGGPECRLKGAYLITCTGCAKDDAGNITEIFATYDPNSRGGDPADGRKVKGATLHWVDGGTALDAEVRLYDNLFSHADPDGGDRDFLDCLNPNSLEILQNCKVETCLGDAAAEDRFQFMRQGYFCVDRRDSRPGHLVFNRAVSLKDSFKTEETK